MSNPFKNIEFQSKILTENLLNESERNNTISSDLSNYSTFDKSYQQGTTFNSGVCIPVMLQECYPGDIYDIDVNSLIRLSAPSSTPFMNINYDLNFFYVPFSQLDQQFYQLMGENNNYGYSDTNINFPLLQFNNSFTYTENDLANYFNIPINVNFQNDSIQIYPFLAYGKIWNDWYRDQNLQSTIDITTCFNNTRTITSSTLPSSPTFYQSIIYGKGLAPCSKFPSYFTTCLPYQQKGNPITIGSSTGTVIQLPSIPVKSGIGAKSYPLILETANGSPLPDGLSLVTTGSGGALGYTVTSANIVNPKIAYANLQTMPSQVNANTLPVTISELRYSIVSQHLLENWALCGSRYVEQLKSIWGIEVDPKNINRCELIGGLNETLIFNNVQQTSQTTTSNQLGKIATNLYNSVSTPHISYAASQHGYIVGILTTRTAINNGGQGLPKLFSYTDFLDLYNPLFNGISEQPILNQEIYYSGNESTDNSTFGFNEPFLNTKYNIDNANGYLSLNSKTSLFPNFLFGEKYTTTPTLNDMWVRYNPNTIGNSLFLVNGSTLEFYHQFIAYFTYSIKYTTHQPLFNSPKIYGI